MQAMFSLAFPFCQKVCTLIIIVVQMSSEQMANIIILYLESNNYRVLSIYVGLFFK